MNKGLKITLGIAGAAVAGLAIYLVFLVKGSADHLILIPKNSVFVGAVNLKSLGSKLDAKQMKNLKMWKYIEDRMKKGQGKGNNKLMKEMMNDPKFSGIDPFSNVYFFGELDSEKEFSGGMVAHLLSSGNFEDFIKSLKVKSDVEEKGGFKQVKVDRNTALAWNKNSALLFVSNAEDTTKLMKDCYILMNQKKEESIISIPEFNEFNKSIYDFAGFFNYSGLSKYFDKMMLGNPLAGIGTMDAMKGAFATAIVNFEDNRVVCKMDVLVKDKVAFEKWNYINKSGLSVEQMKTITPDKIYAVISLSLDMKKLMSIYRKAPGVEMIINEVKSKFSLSDSEIDNLLGGEISIGLVDFAGISPSSAEDASGSNSASSQTEGSAGPNAEEESGMYPPAPPAPTATGMPGITLSLSIKNKVALNKVMGGLGLQKTAEGYYMVPAGFVNVFMVETPGSITMTNMLSIADQLQTRKSLSELKEPVKSYVSKYPACFFWDMDLSHYPKDLLQQLKMMMGEKDFAKFNKTVSVFKNIIIKGDSYSSISELNLSEGKGNSLMKLILVMDEINLH